MIIKPKIKICSNCNLEKDLELFSNNKNGKYGKRSKCKECDKIYRNINKEKASKYNKNYRKENQLSIKKKKRLYYEENKESIKSKRSKYYKENKSKILKLNNKYYFENKEKIFKKRKVYIKSRRENEPLFKLEGALRCRTYSAFKNKKWDKNSRTYDLLKATPELLKSHIEKQFSEGMTWENYGKNGWEADHIIPLSSANTECELRELFKYTNLQPLWRSDNRSKGPKLNWTKTE